MAEYIARQTILDDLDIDIQVTNKKRLLAKEGHCVEDRMRYAKKLDHLRGFREYIKSLSTADVIPIPEGATNGDMVQAMFPNFQINEEWKATRLFELRTDCIEITGIATSDWWNSPYKKEVEE